MAVIMVNKTFLAFTGPEISQAQNIFKNGKQIECWNLKKMDVSDFVEHIKKEVKPVNKRIEEFGYINPDPQKHLGISEELYKEASWGLLLPLQVKGRVSSITGSAPEIKMILNLYSSKFLHPIFSVSEIGIRDLNAPKGTPRLVYFHQQEQSEKFKTMGFRKYYSDFVEYGEYATLPHDKLKLWNAEQWRISTALNSFSDLHEYDFGRSLYMWQKEAADMAIILENLFTATDDSNSEIIYRLKKRIAALSAPFLKDIESDVAALYSLRCKLVHGSIFSSIHKTMKKNKDTDKNFDSPDYDFLIKQRNNIRILLVLYLNLFKRMGHEFKGFSNVMLLLEASIIDTELRKRIHRFSKVALEGLSVPLL